MAVVYLTDRLHGRRKKSSRVTGEQDIREFKIYDATVAKTSLGLSSSSLSIFFVIMSVCLTFESKRDYPGTEFRGIKAGKENPNSHMCVHVLCKTLEMVIARRRFAENGEEMYRNKKTT